MSVVRSQQISAGTAAAGPSRELGLGRSRPALSDLHVAMSLDKTRVSTNRASHSRLKLEDDPRGDGESRSIEAAPMIEHPRIRNVIYSDKCFHAWG